MERIEHHVCFGGSRSLASPLCGDQHADDFFRVSAAAGKTEKCPVLYWLSGLTCNEQNFITKAGAQRYAAEHGTGLSRQIPVRAAVRWRMIKSTISPRCRVLCQCHTGSRGKRIIRCKDYILNELRTPGKRAFRHIGKTGTVAKLAMRAAFGHCCKVSDEAAFVFIQRPYISKTSAYRAHFAPWDHHNKMLRPLAFA